MEIKSLKLEGSVIKICSCTFATRQHETMFYYIFSQKRQHKIYYKQSKVKTFTL